MPEYIRVTDLSKVYRKHEAVKHISFHVGKGQIFAFLGPNGAGKSTTINILSTLLLKSSGSVCIGGMVSTANANRSSEKSASFFKTTCWMGA